MTQKPSDNKQGFVAILRHLFLNNWPIKLLSLILAVVLWSGLITQDPNLTREKAFSDVTISVTGSDAIKRNGFIVVSDLEAEITDARILADVPQLQYQNAKASVYNVRVDLSRVTHVGEQELPVVFTNSSLYGNVSEVHPSTVTVEVDEYITRYRIPVDIRTEGTAPEGFYATSPSMDPPMVAISGPRSLVEKVIKAEAVLDLSSLPAREGLIRQAIPFRLLGATGETIESDLLEVTSESVLLDSVLVEQRLYTRKTVSLTDVGLVTGTPAKGYEIKAVTISPESITGAGLAINMDLLESLYAAGSVDVSGAEETVQKKLRVTRPSELIYMNTDTVTVTVEIGPVITERVFNERRITLGEVDAGMRATTILRSATVTVNGPQNWLEQLRAADVTLTVDVSGLESGVHDLPILCHVKGAEGVNYTVDVAPATVQVTIEKR